MLITSYDDRNTNDSNYNKYSQNKVKYSYQHRYIKDNYFHFCISDDTF